jgi:hypothetical protein
MVTITVETISFGAAWHRFVVAIRACLRTQDGRHRSIRTSRMNEPNQSERKATASRLAKGLSSMVSTAQQHVGTGDGRATDAQPHPALRRDVASLDASDTVTPLVRIASGPTGEPALAMMQRNAELSQQLSREARLETVALRARHHRLIAVALVLIVALLVTVGCLGWRVNDLRQQVDAWKSFGSTVPAGPDLAGTEVDAVAVREQDEQELRRLRSELKDARAALEAANRVMDESMERGRGQASAPRR